MEKLIVRLRLYFRKKDLETVVKKRKEKVEAIVKGLIIDKTSSQSIQMLLEVIELFDEKMDEQLKKDLESSEAITNYKKL